MANRMRGESEIWLTDKLFTLKLGFNELMIIEDSTNLGLLGIADQIIKGNLSLKIVTSIIHAGLLGAGEKFTFEQVGSMILKTGFHKCAAVAIKSYQDAMTPPSQDAVEIKAAPVEKNG